MLTEEQKAERGRALAGVLVLARYVGVYQFANGQTMTVRVDGAQLAVQPTGGNALSLLAESETRFFVRDVNLVVEFVRRRDDAAFAASGARS